MERKRSRLLRVKQLGVDIKEQDYRGIIALVLTVGLIIILWKGDLQAAAIVAGLAGTAVGWYFGSGGKRRK